MRRNEPKLPFGIHHCASDAIEKIRMPRAVKRRIGFYAPEEGVVATSFEGEGRNLSERKPTTQAVRSACWQA